MEFTIQNRQKLLNLLRLEPLQNIENVPQLNNIASIKKKGIYYTPKEVTSYICFQALTSYLSYFLEDKTIDLSEYIKKSPPEELQRLLQMLDNIKVLDPACGAGIFLIEIAEMLLQLKKLLLEGLNKKISDFELKCYIILNSLFGVDFFEDAVEQTKANLLQWIGSDDKSDRGRKSLPLLDWNIRAGNSLIGWLDEELEPVPTPKILTDPLIIKLQKFSAFLSPIMRKTAKKAIKMMYSDDFNQSLEAFFEIQKLLKTDFCFPSSILNDVLQSLHNQLYNCINPSFVKSIISKDLSEKNEAFFIDEIKNLKPLHWKIDFGEIINDGGFDLIVGNPPYVFIRGENFSPFENLVYKQKYLKNYESLAKGKARQSQKVNSFSLFIIRSISLLKNDKFLGFIVPNTILRTTTNDFIRQFILENAFIQEIVDLKSDIFKGITAATLIIFLQKSTNSTNRTLINFNVKNLLNYQFESHFINQINFYKNPVFAFNIHLDSEFENLFNSMRKDTFELGKVTEAIIEGIVCRKNDNLFTNDPSHPLARKLLRGKDIDRYQIHWKPHQYIIYATDTAISKTKLHRPRPKWVHEAPEKLLAQRIGGGIYPLRVAYDSAQYYTFASINNIVFKTPLIFEDNIYLSKYILALLNSKVLNAYYLLNFSNKSALTVNISKTYLESLPLKKSSSVQIQNLISTLVDYLLFLYQADKVNNEEKTRLTEFFDFALLNSLIYEIYLPEELGTDLYKLVFDYISPLPNAMADSAKIKILFEIYQNLQNNPLINQTISKIKTTPIIQKIEDLFQSRN